MHRAVQPKGPRPTVPRRLGVIVISVLLIGVIAAAGVYLATNVFSSPHSAQAADETHHVAPGSSDSALTASPKATTGRAAKSEKRVKRRRTAPPSPTRSARSSAPTSAPTSPAQSVSCKHPAFKTSSPTGGWTDGNYYLYNNMWNASGYSVTQALYACSYSNWYVVANMNNDSGDGAVKTYPNAQQTFSNNPEIRSFGSVSSTFAETSPHVGIYEDAYDIWINGVATSGSTEVMIWTENRHQVPSGSAVASVMFGGRRYQVWKSGRYIAFVPRTNFTSGTLNLLKFFNWIISEGWISSKAELSQICYGAEIVSTNSAPAMFDFTNFSVSTS